MAQQSSPEALRQGGQATGEMPAQLPATDGKPAGGFAAEEKPPAQPDHTHLTGRFNQYTSGYWALALPAMAARYIARYALAFAGQNDPKDMNPKFSGIVGAWMGTITAFYGKRTYDDMKRVFSESVAWEMNKKPEDINIRDLWNSKNDIVHSTMRKYIVRNAIRGGVVTSFFTRLAAEFFTRKVLRKPWHEGEKRQNFMNDRADSVDLGTGVTGAYLVTDVFFRTETLFEKLQNVIDIKINHTDKAGELITTPDLLNIYIRHERDLNKHYAPPAMDSQEWRNDQALFGRMAELMNKTYHNAVNDEQATFTIPKLTYLLGNGYINTKDVRRSAVFIEIASHSAGMHEVKEADAMLKAGATLKDVMRRYGVTAPVPGDEEQAPTASPLAAAFADKMTGKGGRANVLRTRTASDASHVEKLQKSGELGMASPGIG